MKVYVVLDGQLKMPLMILVKYAWSLYLPTSYIREC